MRAQVFIVVYYVKLRTSILVVLVDVCEYTSIRINYKLLYWRDSAFVALSITTYEYY